MEGPRPLQENELQDVVGFLDKNLRTSHGWSIAEEYPLAIDSSNLQNFRIIKNGNEIISSALVKNIIIKNPVGVFKVAAIGSVVTSPSHRNQGLSQKILTECLHTATQQGCDFAILWTDLFDFYRKLGFELAGSEVSLLLDKPIQCSSAELRFLNSKQVAPEALLKLYSKHTTGSIRTPEEIRRYMQIPQSRVFTAWDQNNQIQAYAVEGKGADLQNYIHEWGGGVSKLLPLLAYMQKQYTGPLTLISPSHAQNLVRQLSDQGMSINSGLLGMIKILNPVNLLTKVNRYARIKGIDNFSIHYRQNTYFFEVGSQSYSTRSDGDVTRLVFGPQKASDIYPFDNSSAIESVLPIPMWFWGWDSV